MTLQIDSTYFLNLEGERFVTFTDQRDKLVTLESFPRAKDISQFDSPVTTQTLGSCTADATTNALENQLNQLGIEYSADLSRLFLYWCSRRYLNQQEVDGGSSIRMTVRAATNIGVPTEAQWPMNMNLMATEPPEQVFTAAATYRIGEYFSIRTVNEIASAINQGMPVVLGMVTAEMGAHALCAVGYDFDTNMIKFKNSMGPEYGDKGYVYLSIFDVQARMFDAFAFKLDTTNLPYDKWLKNPITRVIKQFLSWLLSKVL